MESTPTTAAAIFAGFGIKDLTPTLSIGDTTTDGEGDRRNVIF